MYKYCRGNVGGSTMDKYQSKLLERNKQLTLESGQGTGQVELTDSEIVLTQNENYKYRRACAPHQKLCWPYCP